jgi:hypothetical protein
MDDPTAMAEAIGDLLSAAEVRWKAMSDAAYATARARTWEGATDRFESAVREIAASVASRAPATARMPDDDSEPAGAGVEVRRSA